MSARAWHFRLGVPDLGILPGDRVIERDDGRTVLCRDLAAGVVEALECVYPERVEPLTPILHVVKGGAR